MSSLHSSRPYFNPRYMYKLLFHYNSSLPRLIRFNTVQYQITQGLRDRPQFIIITHSPLCLTKMSFSWRFHVGFFGVLPFACLGSTHEPHFLGRGFITLTEKMRMLLLLRGHFQIKIQVTLAFQKTLSSFHFQELFEQGWKFHQKV